MSSLGDSSAGKKTTVEARIKRRGLEVKDARFSAHISLSLEGATLLFTSWKGCVFRVTVHRWQFHEWHGVEKCVRHFFDLFLRQRDCDIHWAGDPKTGGTRWQSAHCLLPLFHP